MVFCTVRELRNNPKTVWKALDAQEDVVITSNGKPRALMIDIEDDNLSEVMDMLVSARAGRAMTKLRMGAIENGTANMSMEKIIEEIALCRAEKRAAAEGSAA